MNKSKLNLLVTAFLVIAFAFAAGVSVAASEKSGGVSPDAALSALKAGNARYVAGKSRHPNQNSARRKETAEKGQNPIAAVIGCADSRVPVEMLFDQGVGDVFAVRVAGNVSAPDEIGSVEYAVEHLGTPMIVILGHSKCGAVTAAVKGGELPGSIGQLVEHIKPAVEEAKRKNPGVDGDALVQPAIEANVRQAISDLMSKSAIVREAVKHGKLKVAGALYDIATGKVTWLDEKKEAAKEAGKEKHSGIEIDAAIKKLKQGNARFLAGGKRANTSKARRAETAKGQKPFAVVLGCSDSRVPAEAIFDQGIGDLFIVRVAGNVCATNEIGSVEYAVEHLGVPVVLVMGHTKCGAVTAAVSGAGLPGSIGQLVSNIMPAVEEAKMAKPDAKGDALIAASIEANVLRSMEEMLRKSAIVRESVKEGKARVIGAIYDIESGKIAWIGDHPKQESLLAAAE
ncbi:MAG: carbonic anhydrase [bacterium]